jgi:hypothetical protein
MTKRLAFYIDTALSGAEMLDRRDELIAALEAAGLRLSMTDCVTDVYLADAGVLTVGDMTAADD